MRRFGPLSVGWQLVTKTLDRFSRDRGDLLAAALAFHSLLSIAPLIIVAIAVAGIVLGRGAAQNEVTRLLAETLGSKGAATVNEWVRQASEGGEVASAIGVILTLLAASRFATQLHSALNLVWKIDVFMAEGFKATVHDYLRRRIFAFGVTVAAGPLLLLAIASRTALSAFPATVFGSSGTQRFVAQCIQIVFAFVSVALTSAVVFRYVPDTRIGWKNVLVGGAVTSLLFNLGNVLVGLYLTQTSVAVAYGAAGSLVVVLLWLHFSAQIFLFGAEFTRVFAEHFGAGLSPDELRELSHVRESAVRGRAVRGPLSDPFVTDAYVPGGGARGAPPGEKH